MTPYRKSEDEAFPSPDLAFEPGGRAENRLGQKRFDRRSRRRRWDRIFSPDDMDGRGAAGEAEYEGQPSESGAWTGSAEQQAFRQQVLDAHLARSRKSKGAPQPDLTPAQLAPVRGTPVSMRADAAQSASRLLEAAQADLLQARAAGHPDALRTARLSANSGYRGSGHQLSLWRKYFPNYYDKTARGRGAFAEGPHSAKAVSYLLDVFKLPNRIAAPGYSNHQGGIAIDFEQERAKGYGISNSYEAAEQKKWRASWFYDWLLRNAARFGFQQYIKEAWHWEYRPDVVTDNSGTGVRTQEFESEYQPATKPFLGGYVHTYTSASLPVTISVFCPNAARSLRTVEVLVYAHGLLNPCPPVPRRLPEGFITGAPFRLGEIVDASGRGIILVVPYFEWRPGRRHALGQPANLNAVVREALAAVGAIQGGPPPALSNLILAGHSRAYDFLEPLAHAYADPQMRQGALAKLTQIWALDTTYVCDVNAWMKWLQANPRLQANVFFPQERRR